MPKHKVALLIDAGLRKRIFDEPTWTELNDLFDVAATTTESHVSDTDAAVLLRDAEGCITGWGSPRLTGEVIDAAGGLRVVVHSAGTVKPFVSDALWDRGIVVTSASAEIARYVAETTLGLIILSLKAVWQAADATSRGEWRFWNDSDAFRPREMVGKTVGIAGSGHVGRRVIELLRPFGVNLLVYDPTLSKTEIGQLGARKVELDEMVSRSDVVSLHAPDIDETRHMVNASNLPMMKDGAILINTARGALIDEAALIGELEKNRIFACLDVTDPEPPAPDSKLRSLPNVILTPHIAGCVENGQYSLGRAAKEELRRFFAGEPLLHPVTRAMLSRIG